jgi:hypothetical protein
MQKSQPRNIFRFENLLQNRLYLFCWDNWLESPIWIISEPRCLLGYQNTVIFELLKLKKKKQQLEFHQMSKSRIKFPKGPRNVILRIKGNSSHHDKHQILQAREPFLVSCVHSLRTFIVKLRKKPAFL